MVGYKRDSFDELDQERLQKAKDLLLKVYEFNYGTPGMSGKIKRLETILAKLETLQNLK